MPSQKDGTILAIRGRSWQADAAAVDILFSSNHNINKSSAGICFWELDPLIDGFY